jgi:hypothetical protein
MLCLSYYCLCLLFNKIGEKGRTGSAWKQGARGAGEGRGREQEGEMAPKMYAHMNKLIKKKIYVSTWVKIQCPRPNLYLEHNLNFFEISLFSKFL